MRLTTRITPISRVSANLLYLLISALIPPCTPDPGGNPPDPGDGGIGGYKGAQSSLLLTAKMEQFDSLVAHYDFYALIMLYYQQLNLKYAHYGDFEGYPESVPSFAWDGSLA